MFLMLPKEMRGKSNNQALKGIETYLPSYLKPTPKEIKKPKPIERKTLLNKPSLHQFAYNYCTDYVAKRKSVSWSGNARDWFENAKAQKYWTGQDPRTGAVLIENIGYYGHCSIVTKVRKNWFIVSEMNYKGWGVISERKINKNEEQIIGFIYSVQSVH